MEKEQQDWFYRKQAERAIKQLRKNCFEAMYVPDAKAAAAEVMGRVSREICIGMGDSQTLREIGVVDTLLQGGYQLLNPWQKGISRAESLDRRRKALTSDVFLSGANAVTLDGKLVCIDGLGNRVAGLIFGPLKVIVAVGANKIVADVDAALARIKKVAAPVNVHKHGFDPSVRPPCGETGTCSDCKMPRRICVNTAIIEGCRQKERTCVLIIGEALGY